MFLDENIPRSQGKKICECDSKLADVLTTEIKLSKNVLGLAVKCQTRISRT